MEENQSKKGKKIIPSFKNLGFIVPKKNKRPGESTKRADGSLAENSPRIADDSSNSSASNSVEISDSSDTSNQNVSDREELAVTDTKSVSKVKKATKPEFAKPFGAIFKKDVSKKTDTNSCGSVVEKTPKETSQKKVVGTPLTDEQYDDIFGAVMERVSQLDSPVESETNFENVREAPDTQKIIDGNVNELIKPVFAKPSTFAPVVKKSAKKAPSIKSIAKKQSEAVVGTAAKKSAAKPPSVKSISKKQSEPVNNQKNGSDHVEKHVETSPVANVTRITTKAVDKNLNNEEHKEIAVVAREIDRETETYFENTPSKSLKPNEKQVQSKKGMQSIKSPKASTSGLKENQRPRSRANQSDSNTSDDFDSEMEQTEASYSNTQTTKWGKDRSIIYDKPPKAKTYKDRMLYLRKCRDIGLWVKCSSFKGCGKWRYCREIKDPLQIPKIWTCSMNSDPEFNSCDVPEQRQPSKVENEVDVITSKYSAGSIVWAYIPGSPWWPAMVDDDPNTETFWWLNDPESTVPNWFHVVFFDWKYHSVSRAWVKDHSIVPFDASNSYRSVVPPNLRKKDKSFVPRVKVATEDANNALAMPVSSRLEKYGFISRYRGPIRKPTLEIESSSEDEDSQRCNTSSIASISLRPRVQGERETRKRKKLNKIKALIKKRKLMSNYTSSSVAISSRSKKESESEDSEGDSETERMQVDEDREEGEEEDEVQEVDDGEKENDNENDGEDNCDAIEAEDDGEKVIVIEDDGEDNCDAIEAEDNGEEGNENVNKADENENYVDENVDNNNMSNSSTCFNERNNSRAVEATEMIPPSQAEEKSKIGETKNKQPVTSAGEKDSSSTFFNEQSRSSEADSESEIDVVDDKYPVQDDPDLVKNLQDNANYEFPAIDNYPRVVCVTKDDYESDGEWSDKSIISDVDSNATINVDDVSNSTIDVCSSSNCESDRDDVDH